MITDLFTDTWLWFGNLVELTIGNAIQCNVRYLKRVPLWKILLHALKPIAPSSILLVLSDTIGRIDGPRSGLSELKVNWRRNERTIATKIMIDKAIFENIEKRQQYWSFQSLGFRH